MYKLLATSALVAAGLWGMTEAASAQAKVAPITAVVGGYHEQTFGHAGNKDGVNNATAAPLVNAKPNKMAQFSDSEIFFGGRTTLANGIVIGFDVQLEANSSSDQIDESYIFVDGAFGRFLIGSENSADAIMHMGTPAAGRAYGTNGSSAQGWIYRPVNVTVISDPASPGCAVSGGTAAMGAAGCDAQRVTYFTPRFAGFQFGVSYTPNTSREDANNFDDDRASRTNGMHGSANYMNNFGGVTLNASAGISTYGKIDNAVANTANNSDVKDYALGLQVGASGFLVGASYRNVDVDRAVENGDGWSVGATYTTGPLSVGLSYLKSETDGTAAAGKDKLTQVLFSANYQIGPGVDLIGSIFNIKWEDEGSAKADNNKGTGVIGGFRLTF
jgi:predicted porin